MAYLQGFIEGITPFNAKVGTNLNIENPPEKEGKNTMAKCPLCGKEYEDRPAISRKDNKTEICPDCGTLEALESIGASDEMKDEVLKTIHEARKGAGL